MPKTTVPIFADDDLERLDDARRAVRVAERNAAEAATSPLRIGDAPVAVESDPNVKEARAAYDKVLDEAAERADGWVLETIGFGEFRELLKQHPPRMITEPDEDGSDREVVHPDDENFRVNAETFPKELLLYVDPEDPEIRTIAELNVDGEDIATDMVKVKRRVKRLSEGQFKALWTTAFVLNTQDVVDPKLNRFSAITRRSDET